MAGFHAGDGDSGIGFDAGFAIACVGVKAGGDIHGNRKRGYTVDRGDKFIQPGFQFALESCAKDGVDHQAALANATPRQFQVIG